MDVSFLLGMLSESLFLIAVFGVMLLFGMARGTQSIINAILALYIALVITLKFPYFDALLKASSEKGNALIMILFFAAFTVLGTILLRRIIPVEYRETPFAQFGKKIVLALLATALVMAFSYHALPVTDVFTPGSPIQALFAPEERFFWWLLAPLVVLFFM